MSDHSKSDEQSFKESRTALSTAETDTLSAKEDEAKHTEEQKETPSAEPLHIPSTPYGNKSEQVHHFEQPNQATHNQQPYIQQPYAQQPFNQQQYAQQPFNQQQYAQQPFNQQPYMQQPFAQQAGYSQPIYPPQIIKTNNNAIAALVLSFVGLFIPIIGAITSIISIILAPLSMKQIKQSNGMENGTALAIVALVIAALVLFFYFIYSILIIIPLILYS